MKWCMVFLPFTPPTSMKCIKGSFTNRSNSNPLFRSKWEVFFRKFSKKIPKIDLVMLRMDGNKFKIILSFDKLTFPICFLRNIDRILFQQWWVFFSFFEKLTSHFFGKLSKNVSGKWLHYNWEKSQMMIVLNGYLTLKVWLEKHYTKRYYPDDVIIFPRKFYSFLIGQWLFFR